MPSLGDSVFIFILALMLFGPKKLPQLARQLGKLMAEFRRASNEFRMQMEDELRIEDQKEHQKKVDALAGPPSSAPDPTIPTEDPPHPHLPPPAPIQAEAPSAVAPIAESGDLRMMPPSTGFPVESSARNGHHAGSSNGNTPAAIPAASEPLPHIEEHAIGTGLPSSSLGLSSEDPGEAVFPGPGEAALGVEPALAFEPAPDRSRPAMVGEGERATHA